MPIIPFSSVAVPESAAATVRIIRGLEPDFLHDLIHGGWASDLRGKEFSKLYEISTFQGPRFFYARTDRKGQLLYIEEQFMDCDPNPIWPE